ncbi:LysR, substrate-binding [Shewanella denitrificans OS217]|uniref:LysR, substrate-binding n=1 Tax=Shewanella denitrificans (strain OS217 / ATCC BAA-1090 / DSM 15013) TaxID=318161 RepID=Q12KE7_SHEDO|nr:LysR family transcriptional regulator [Shewanella denitrificans]ABE56079.1 LysR, substrate-binding [Shewanella denitrificans OS217]
MDWLTATKSFNLLVEHGSFSQAAAVAEISPSAMSKRIDWLEKQLGLSLFVRTTRQVNLTEAGFDFLSRSKDLVGQFEDMISETQQFANRPSGTLRVAANSVVGSAILMPCIEAFLVLYPEVTLHLDILPFGEFPDLDHDLVLCRKFDNFNSSAHRGTKLYNYRVGLYAAPHYLANNPAITQLADVSEHKMVMNNYYRKQGRLEMANGESCELNNFNFISDNVDALLYAATKGMGLFFASPLYLKRELEQGLLVPVLPHLQGQEMELWGFYPNKKYLPIKTRLLLDFLKAKLVST